MVLIIMDIIINTTSADTLYIPSIQDGVFDAYRGSVFADVAASGFFYAGPGYFFSPYRPHLLAGNGTCNAAVYSIATGQRRNGLIHGHGRMGRPDFSGIFPDAANDRPQRNGLHRSILASYRCKGSDLYLPPLSDR